MTNPYAQFAAPANPYAQFVTPGATAAAPDASQWGPVSQAVNSASFGMGPKLDEWLGAHAPSWLTGGQHPNAAQEQASADAWAKGNPKSALAASLVGGSIPFLATGGAAGGLGLAGRAAAMAATGAAGQGGAAYVNGQDPTAPAIEGALGGAAGEVGGSAIGKLIGALGRGAAGAFKPEVSIPTAGSVQAAKTAAYDASEAAGDVASPQGLARLKGNIQGEMANFGYDPSLQPGGGAVIDRMNTWPQPGAAMGTPPLAGVTLKGLDGFRQVASRMSESGKSGAELASRIRGHIDEFVSNPQPGDWITGEGPSGGQALNEGRRLAQIGFKSEALSDAMEKAADEANTAGTGGNMRNKLAQAAKKLKWSDQNWTPDEKSALQGAITPQPGEQLMRVLGKGDPTSHGGAGMVEGVATLLGALHDPATLAFTVPAMVGAGAARRLSDALVKDSTNRIGETILNGGVNPYADSAAQAMIRSRTPMLQRGSAGLLSSALAGLPQSQQ